MRTTACLLGFAICWPQVAAAQITFRDVTEETGLREPLAGIMGHGAALGDIDGDGKIDLFVGGFADRPNADYAPADGPVPSILFLQRDGKFEEVANTPARHFARTSGAVFADLDNDGDLDLYVANNRKGRISRKTEPQRTAQARGSALFRNDEGKFVDVSSACGACPDSLLTARNVGVFDFDKDGLLDLFVVEDKFTKDHSSRLFRNLGGFKFKDATVAAGLPEDIYGLGLATGDLNDDGHTDMFVPHSNRLFLGAVGGKFEEVTGDTANTFRWEPLDNEDWPCGAVFADLNRDARPEIVLSIHSVKARNRVYVNIGNSASDDGAPRFRDATPVIGFPDHVPVRCPHVEVHDFDLDGWPDIFLSAGWLDDKGAITPLIFRHRGTRPGAAPKFVASGDFAKDMVYYPAAPTGDFDNDGRRDLFLVNWFQGNWSRVLRNTSTGGRWLQVRVEGKTFNRMGIGTKIRASSGGELIAYGEVSIGYGYASGQTGWLPLGLGDATSVDLEIVFPNGERRSKKGVPTNQRLVIREEEQP